MNNPHYFIGIQVPKKMRAWILDIQHKCKEELSYKMWTHPDDLHITLKFLGAVDDEKLHHLVHTLKQIEKTRFEVTIGGLGSFGKPNQPRVLWTGVENNNQLKDLQQMVASYCEEVGFAQENRPFTPHVTLAKKWAGDGVIAQTIPELFADEDKMNTFVVTQFTLFKIHPQEKPKYEAVHQFELYNK